MQVITLEPGRVRLGKSAWTAAPGETALEQIVAWAGALAHSTAINRPKGPVAAFLPDDWVRAVFLEVPKGASPEDSQVLQAYGLWRYAGAASPVLSAFWPTQQRAHTVYGVGAFLDPALAQAFVTAFSASGLQLAWLGPQAVQQASPEAYGQANLLPQGSGALILSKQKHLSAALGLGLILLGLIFGNIRAHKKIQAAREQLQAAQQLWDAISLEEARKAQLSALSARLRQSGLYHLPLLFTRLETCLDDVFLQGITWEDNGLLSLKGIVLGRQAADPEGLEGSLESFLARLNIDKVVSKSLLVSENRLDFEVLFIYNQELYL